MTIRQTAAMKFGALIAACSLVALPGLAQDKKKVPDQIGSRDVGKGINLYSLEKEMAMGRQLAEEVRRQAELLDDPIVTRNM